MNLPFEFNKQNLSTLFVTGIMMLLGIAGYDLTFHPEQDNQTLSVLGVTETQPLTIFELSNVNYDHQCIYDFVVIADAVLEKDICFEQINGMPCGCKAKDEDFFFGRPKKVRITNYNGLESILNAIEIPEGWKVKKWTHSQVWYISKTNCKEPILDQPKLKDEK